ncbi:MAG: hypothetical protein ACI4MS_06250 [Candidatus Coproplasma sp.]
MGEKFFKNNKVNVIILFLIHITAIMLCVMAILSDFDNIILSIDVYTFCIMFFAIFKILFDFLWIKIKKGVVAIGVFVVAFFIGQICVSIAYTSEAFYYHTKTLFYSNYMILVCGYLNALSFFILTAIKFFYDALNINFKGGTQIKLFRKVVEVFLQIAMLPMSFFIQLWTMGFFVGLHLLGGEITRSLIFCGMKKEDRGKGYSYNVGASDKIVSTTVTHEIRDNYGRTVGTYDTVEQHVEHDDGGRYEYSDQFKSATKISFVALPCRVISLLFSIIALFVPKLSVSLIKPKTNYKYNEKIFRYLDILIFDNE